MNAVRPDSSAPSEVVRTPATATSVPSGRARAAPIESGVGGGGGVDVGVGGMDVGVGVGVGLPWVSESRREWASGSDPGSAWWSALASRSPKVWRSAPAFP